MSETAVTVAGDKSKDLDAMIAKIVDSYPGMTAWLVVRADGRIVDGVADMRVARKLATFTGKGSKVRNATSKRIVFIAA